MGYEAFIAHVGAVVMGRTTYEWIRRHLEASGEGWSYAMPTWVVTHADLPGLEGADIPRHAGRRPSAVPATLRPRAHRPGPQPSLRVRHLPRGRSTDERAHELSMAPRSSPPSSTPDSLVP